MGWRSRGLNPIRVILALMSSPIRLLYLIAIGVGPASARSPHIIMILADDMGWNDVSFHGSNEIPTPNIDALAYNGIILNKHYVQPLCSPSRGALMTGTYPIHLGMQGLPFFGPEARGLPPGPTLPQYLRRLGYSTHGIGKWHLGYASNDLLPTRRGFDSFLGYYNGYISYYDHIHEYTRGDLSMSGHDLRRNETNAWDLQGRYATDIFTEEAESVIHNHDLRSGPLFLFLSHLAVHSGNEGKSLEAPQADIDLFRHITDPNRRTYAAMMHRLDQSVGQVVRALDTTGMLSDSIIIFMSDNGAPTRGIFRNWGSNYPLRGIKRTLWEGCVRSAALIWSPRLYGTPRVSEELFHISDWLPTLYTAAGGSPLDLPPLDGIDQWASLKNRLPSRRTEILVNIDEVSKTASVIRGQYKLVVGTHFGAKHDGHYGQSTSKPKSYSFGAVSQSIAARAIAATSVKSGRRVLPPVIEDQMQWLRNLATVRCRDLPDDGPDPTENGTVNCLYNLVDDPCERRNLLKISPSYKYKEQELKRALKSYYVTVQRQIPLTVDIAGADPRRFNGAWSPWLSETGGFDKPDTSETPDQAPSGNPNQSVATDLDKDYDESSNTTDGAPLDTGSSESQGDSDLSFDDL